MSSKQRTEPKNFRKAWEKTRTVMGLWSLWSRGVSEQASPVIGQRGTWTSFFCPPSLSPSFRSFLLSFLPPFLPLSLPSFLSSIFLSINKYLPSTYHCARHVPSAGDTAGTETTRSPGPYILVKRSRKQLSKTQQLSLFTGFIFANSPTC